MNFQNIPRKDKVVKQAFVPKLDAFLLFDYKNVELRLLAYYLTEVGDWSMVEAFKEGRDLHEETARAIFNKAQVSDEERQLGKIINFLLSYSGTERAIIEALDCDWPTAHRYVEGFYKAWPAVVDLNEAVQRTYQERGYVKTLFGRQLHPLKERATLNAIIQGCAADMMKWAMVSVHAGLQAGGFFSHIVNTIHDELILDALRLEIERLVELVPQWMTYEPVNEIVPIEVDVEVSWTTWAEKESYGGMGTDRRGTGDTVEEIWPSGRRAA